MAEAEAAQVRVQLDGEVAVDAAVEGEQNVVMASQSVPDESNDAAAVVQEEAKAEDIAQPAEAAQTEEVVMASASEE